MKLRSTPLEASRTSTISGSPGAAGGQAVEAALQVLGGLDDVGGEFLHGILACLVHFPAAAGAHIGHLGLGAHPAVLHLRQFGFQFGDAGGGGLHELFRRLRAGQVGIVGAAGVSVLLVSFSMAA